MQFVEFQVPGPPVAWHRTEQGKGRRYKNDADVKYQKVIRLASVSALSRYLTENRNARWTREGEFLLSVCCNLPDLRRRDVDNLAKNIMDGLTGTLYADDAQVVDLRIYKLLRRNDPQVLIHCRAVEGYMVEAGELRMLFPVVTE